MLDVVSKAETLGMVIRKHTQRADSIQFLEDLQTLFLDWLGLDPVEDLFEVKNGLVLDELQLDLVQVSEVPVGPVKSFQVYQGPKQVDGQVLLAEVFLERL